MKKWQRAMALACAGLMSVSAFAGCQVDDGTSSDPLTINVRALKASWGENWINELVEKFETAYATENWKVNVLKPTADIRGGVVTNELYQGYENTAIDMYITGDLTSASLGQEHAEYETFGVLAEEIGHLWDKKAIGFDGQEEDKTLREKVVKGIDEGSYDIYGKCYTLPYMAQTGGLVVNLNKLGFYGITELPRTTDELFEVWDTIYTGYNQDGEKVYDNTEKSKLAPFTYTPGTKVWYTIDWATTLLAQYDAQQYSEWISWQTTTETGYDWFQGDVAKTVESDMVLETLTVLAQAFDTNLAARGTASQSLDQAQAQIMKSKQGAVFMCNGSWYLNDMAIGYKDDLDKITFMNYPVISAIADKLWADTVSDEAKREEMLRYAIDQVDDETKMDDAAAIAADMSDRFATEVTEDDVKDIRRARGVYSDRMTSGSTLLITKGVSGVKKEICETFIRFMASDDAARVMAESANATSAYMQEENTYSNYRFVKDASKIAVHKYASPAANKSTGQRYVLGQTGNFLKNGHITSVIVGRADAKSIYDGKGGRHATNTTAVYRELAVALQKEEADHLKANIATWEASKQAVIARYTQIYTDRGITIE